MTIKNRTMEDLLNHLEMDRRISVHQKEAIERHLIQAGQTKDDPFFLRFLSGAGAWLAAAFLIGFLLVADIITDDVGAAVCGMTFLIAAILATRKKGHFFLRQFALALAISGHLLVLGSVSTRSAVDVLTHIWITHTLLWITVYPLLNDGVYRFLVSAALPLPALIWIYREHRFEWIHMLIAAEVVLAGVLLLKNKLHPALAPLRYASVTILLSTFLFLNISQMSFFQDVYDGKVDLTTKPSSLMLSLALIGLYFRLSGHASAFRKPWMILAVASTLFLGVFTTPGLLAGIGILVAGYALGDKAITGIASLFLPCFLMAFYYALNVNLACKSWVVAGSGILLIVIRYIADRIRPKEARS